MTSSRFARTVALALALGVVQLATAQTAASPEIAAALGSSPIVTKHDGKFGGERVRYTATVEALPVSIASGASADIVSFAYTRDGIDASQRPVIFLFNGGPIVPSPYVHIGGIGPRRVFFPDDVTADRSTFKLVDNPYSPIDAADLVFVDPASTGFSRVTGKTRPADFFGNVTDAAQFIAFIKAWQKRHNRQGSPVYLFGESYGTHRAAEIAKQTAEDPDPLPLKGIFLYGQAVNVMEWSQRPANIISYVASLPTLAATAWFHGKIDRKGRSVDQFIAEANAYAKGPYLTALYQGSALPDAQRREVAGQLEAYSGIPAAWYVANDLKITKERFRIELLKQEKRLLGRSDSRYTAAVTEAGGAPDPAELVGDAVLAFFQDYMRAELKVPQPEIYLKAVPEGEMKGWDWGPAPMGAFSDFPYYQGIGALMKKDPDFRLTIGNGYYDTMTTLGGAELLATQSGYDPARVDLRFYDGGHMGYSVDATARAVGEDIRKLVR